MIADSIHTIFVFIGTVTVAAATFIFSLVRAGVGYLGALDWRLSLYLGVASILVLVPLGFFTEVVALPYQMFRSIVVFFGIGTSSGQWCVVYDSRTKKPIDPAYVTVLDMQGKEVLSAVTDLDGRFALLLPRGLYRIKVQKTNYEFPSQRLVGAHRDGYYSNLYFGGTITVQEHEEVVTVSIPLDPIGADWNQKEKQRRGLFLRPERMRIYRNASLTYTIFGALLVIARSFVVHDRIMQPLYLFYVLWCAAGIVYALFRPAQKPQSVVIDKQTGEPLSFAEVQVFNARGDQVARKHTTLHGQFVCLLPTGSYSIRIAKRDQHNQYQNIYTSDHFFLPNGYMAKKFEV